MTVSATSHAAFAASRIDPDPRTRKAAICLCISLAMRSLSYARLIGNTDRWARNGGRAGHLLKWMVLGASVDPWFVWKSYVREP